MKLTVSIALMLIVLATSGVAQQKSLDSVISDLQRQIQAREFIDRNSRTSANLRVLNRRVLDEKRTELRSAVQTRIGQLQSYLSTLGPSATPEERQYVETSLRHLQAISHGLPGSAGAATTMNSIRPRVIDQTRIVANVPSVIPRDQNASPIRLEPVREGDSTIRGWSPASVNEIVVEIRTRETGVPNSNGASYSHTTQDRQRSATVAYRIERFYGNRDAWPFTLKLSKPLTSYQELRAIASRGASTTQWIGVLASYVGSPSATATNDETVRSLSRSQGFSVQRSGQNPSTRILRPQPNPEKPVIVDPCEVKGKLLNINIDWATGSVSPSQIKRSGDYCVTVSNANTILYSYSVRVEAEEVTGNPFDILKDAIDSLGKFGGSAGAAGAAGTKGLQGIKPQDFCELIDLITNVKSKAADLQSGIKALLPGETGGKIDSIPLDTTLKAWDPIPDRFKALKEVAERLREAKNGNPPNCAAEIAEANTILESFDRVQVQYAALHARVNGSRLVRVRADDLDAADNTKITVKEYYGFRETNAKELVLKVPAGYHAISASAGFLLTQLPARSYSSRTSPDPSNPTATQNVLGVDYGAGTRPALTALLNYNLPFKRERDFGLALSAGPVYDISGGKADTSKFGFFGGVSARFSRWLYITPGLHVGEFADFPQGFNSTGQVIPNNTGTPVPVKRYTTRFALAVTFKVRDLGSAAPPK